MTVLIVLTTGCGTATVKHEVNALTVSHDLTGCQDPTNPRGWYGNGTHDNQGNQCLNNTWVVANAMSNAPATVCALWVVKGCQSTSPAKIEAELSRSPLKGLGAYIYNLGVQYGVDSNFFTAIAKAESLYATVPSIALSNHNPGSLRPGRGGATQQRNNFAYFDTWQLGIEAFFRHISGFYFGQNRTTVDNILVLYAPPAENDTTGYIGKIKNYMDLLRIAR